MWAARSRLIDVGGDSVTKYNQFSHSGTPVWKAAPIFLYFPDCQKEKFQSSRFSRKAARVLITFLRSRLKALYGIGCINKSADIWEKIKEGDHLIPGIDPLFGDVRVSEPQFRLCKSVQFLPRISRVYGPVNGLQRAGYGLVILISDEFQTVPDQVNNAGLQQSVGKGSLSASFIP